MSKHQTTITGGVVINHGRSQLKDYRVTCEKCGLVDKARTLRDAENISARHETTPHK